jgi:hypothetical protein
MHPLPWAPAAPSQRGAATARMRHGTPTAALALLIVRHGQRHRRGKSASADVPASAEGADERRLGRCQPRRLPATRRAQGRTCRRARRDALGSPRQLVHPQVRDTVKGASRAQPCPACTGGLPARILTRWGCLLDGRRDTCLYPFSALGQLSMRACGIVHASRQVCEKHGYQESKVASDKGKALYATNASCGYMSMHWNQFR